MTQTVRLFLVLLMFAAPVRCVEASTKGVIANIDQSFQRDYETAVKNESRFRQSAIKDFLSALDYLERAYKGANDQASLLAVQHVRSRYDAQAEKVAKPTVVPDVLQKAEAQLQRRLEGFASSKSTAIKAALERRKRFLESLRSGLLKRGDDEGAKLVFDAISRTPTIPSTSTPKAVTPSNRLESRRVMALEQLTPLTFHRPTERWQELKVGKVPVSVDNGTTTVRFEEGEHWLLKVTWPVELNVGDRFSVEIQGAGAVELVDLDGPDAATGVGTAKETGFVSVEIERKQTGFVFRCNGGVREGYGLYGKLRGKAAMAEMFGSSLQPAFTLKKGKTVSFRNAQIVRASPER